MGWSDKTDSVEEQLKTLQSMGKQWVGITAIAVFMVPGLLLLYMALSKREYGLIPFVFAFGFFALIVNQGLPHIRRAIQGIDSNDRCDGTAKISIEESSETTYYKADVTVPLRGRWIFHFRPQGWTPEEVQLSVECRFIHDFDWPVLVVSESGLIHPSEKPKTIGWNN